MPTMDQATALINKYKRTKDLAVLSELYAPYMPIVYGVCLKYFKNESSAEDAVMDIYEKLSKKLLTSKVDTFKPWLYMVSRNHCIEVLRRQNSRRPKESEAQRVYYDTVLHPDTVEDDREKALLTCIEQLDDAQREVIQLFYYKKMSYIDIAEQIESDYNKVRSRIQNGRRNLKTCIEKKTK